MLFFYTVTTSIQAFITTCGEVLYPFVTDLFRQSIKPPLDVILHFFNAFEAFATQKFLQCWE